MKLLLAVISKDDAEETLKKLAENKISAAQIASNGTGFFVPGNSTAVALNKLPCEAHHVAEG